MTGVNWVALTIVLIVFVFVTGGRLRRRPVAAGGQHGQPGRVGARRARLRHVRDVVPAGRRPLHRVHVHRGAGSDVRDRRGERLLRGAVHDHRLSDHLHLHAAAVVGLAPARLRDAGRLRGGPATAPAGSALAVAVTGILATMPYIALQLVGIQAVLEVMGIGGSGNVIASDLPLFIAFAVLAAYTYSSGLRAPALIAFVKDTLIYLVIIVAVVYIADEDRRSAPRSTRPRRRWPRSTRRPGSRPGSFIPPTAPVLGVRVARAGLGDGAVHVPALDHRRALLPRPQRDPPQRGHPAGVLARCSGCWRCSGSPRSPRAPSRSGWTASRTRSWWCRSSSRTASRAGSPGSRSPRSRSARWCRRRSCRSRRRTCSPATSTGRTSSARLRGRRKPRSRRSPRWWSSSARCCSSWPWTGRTRSTSSCSAASGSCRRSRRSCSGSTPAGSTGGRCSSAGRWG